MKRKQTIQLCILLLFLLLAGSALAEAPLLWVSRSGEYAVDAIRAEKTKDGYILYLPGSLEKEDLRIGVA